MYRIAIVEDQQVSMDLLNRYLKKYGEEHQETFIIHEFCDGLDIVSDYIDNLDIIFLDIEMKNMNGMEAAEKIRKIDKRVVIIFVTNMSDYAIRGYSVDAMSFLLKPLPYFAFSQEMHKSLERIKARKDKFILVPAEEGMMKVNTNEIKFVEVMKHSLTIHTLQNEITFRGTMKEMEKLLSEHHFFRCNNSYLVNLAMVGGIQSGYAIVANHQLKISRSKTKEFMEALTAFIGRRL
ncbi:MAG: LytTR family DNA-binding domain-containing protein [Acholeplasmataceae bacterium]|nr:LytTR family DNA-binding domain-containing protein [Acholeplasmataceae bacterium]